VLANCHHTCVTHLCRVDTQYLSVHTRGAGLLLPRVYGRGVAIGARYGWELAGAWKTAMVDEDECILLWAIPTWQRWAEFEKAHGSDGEVQAWRASVRHVVETWQRIVLVDAPLSPFRTGRQPSRADR